MKFAISKSLARDVLTLQASYQVTLISDKGLVFMHRDDWVRICQVIDEGSQVMTHLKSHNALLDSFCFWSECFTVALDESKDFSCHAVVNFEFFELCCRRCNIWTVLLPMWDLISYVRQFDAHHNNDALGCYIESRGDVLIDVEEAIND